MLVSQLHFIATCCMFVVYPVVIKVIEVFFLGGIVGVFGVDFFLCCANVAHLL